MRTLHVFAMLTLDTALALITTYKYWIIFPISVAEGPMITVLGGFLVSNGVLNPLLAYVILVLGDIVGDSLYYALGRFGGDAFFKRYGYWFGIDQKKLLELELHFKEHGAKWVWFSKTQPIGSAILATAGITRFPLGQFLLASTLSSSIKTMGFFLLGYFFGEAYAQIDNTLNRLGLIVFVLTLVLGFFYLMSRRKKLA